MKSNLRTWLGGFFEGFTGGSLLFRARHPGIPTKVFADEGSESYPQRELVEEMKRREAESRKV
jgi:hypothetical protein